MTMSLLDNLLTRQQARGISAAQNGRPPVRQFGLNQYGPDAIANFGMMLPGLVGQIADYQNANKAALDTEQAQAERELFYQQLEAARKAEAANPRRGPLAAGVSPRNPAGYLAPPTPLSPPPGEAGTMPVDPRDPNSMRYDVPAGPLAPGPGAPAKSYQELINTIGMTKYPEEMLKMQELQLEQRKQDAKEAGMNPPGMWSLEDMRKEYDYSKYMPESVKAAELARDPMKLVPKPDEITFQNKMAATKHVAAQLAPFEEVAQSTQKIGALLQRNTGPAELGALISWAKALDPGSVVREGEVTMQQQAAGIIARWENLVEQMNRTGSALSGPHKQGILDGARDLQEIYKQRYKWHREHYERMLKDNGISLDFMPPKVRFTELPKTVTSTLPTPEPAKPPLAATPEESPIVQQAKKILENK